MNNYLSEKMYSSFNYSDSTFGFLSGCDDASSATMIAEIEMGMKFTYINR